MKELLFIAIGIIIGYIGKDLLTKESEVIYHIKRLRAKKGGSIDVDGNVTVEKNRRTRRKLRKNK